MDEYFQLTLNWGMITYPCWKTVGLCEQNGPSSNSHIMFDLRIMFSSITGFLQHSLQFINLSYLPILAKSNLNLFNDHIGEYSCVFYTVDTNTLQQNRKKLNERKRKLTSLPSCFPHDDVIAWKRFPHYWSFGRGIHWVNGELPSQWVSNAILIYLLSANSDKLLNKMSTCRKICTQWRSFDVNVMYAGQNYFDVIGDIIPCFESIWRKCCIKRPWTPIARIAHRYPALMEKEN